MSTLATADLSSDDENDLDFKLPETKAGPSRKRQRSGSASSSGSSADDGIDAEEAKKLKADQAAAEADERRKRADAAFEAMKDGTDSTVQASAPVVAEMVEIQRARRFAGETLYETVKLPADDPEVIAYCRREARAEDPDVSSFEASATPAKPVVESPAGETRPKTKPPPRRKPRQSLEAMSAALDKGKKMSTLEKSQMDWKRHTGDDKAVHDELEANRRAGGYLQKKDFLDRVGERRMETFEDTRKGRR